MCEAVDGLITRQIHVYGDRRYRATREAEDDERYFVTDRPELGDDDGEDVDRDEFERLWGGPLRP